MINIVVLSSDTSLCFGHHANKALGRDMNSKGAVVKRLLVTVATATGTLLSIKWKPAVTGDFNLETEALRAWLSPRTPESAHSYLMTKRTDASVVAEAIT